MFQTLLLIGMVTAMGVTLYFRRRATRMRQTNTWRDDHLLSRLAIRIGSALLAFGIVMHTFKPKWYVDVPAETTTSPALAWTGVGFGLGGLLLLAWAFHSLGPNWSDSVETGKEHELIAHGPYRWVRHPLYTANGILVIAMILLTSSWTLGLIGGALLLFLMFRAVQEELRLEQRFGASYVRYAEQTGRFLPKVRFLHARKCKPDLIR